MDADLPGPADAAPRRREGREGARRTRRSRTRGVPGVTPVPPDGAPHPGLLYSPSARFAQQRNSPPPRKKRSPPHKQPIDRPAAASRPTLQELEQRVHQQQGELHNAGRNAYEKAGVADWAERRERGREGENAQKQSRTQESAHIGTATGDVAWCCRSPPTVVNWNASVGGPSTVAQLLALPD